MTVDKPPIPLGGRILDPRETKYCPACHGEYFQHIASACKVSHAVSQPSATLDMAPCAVFKCIRCGSVCDLVTNMIIHPVKEPMP